MRVELSPRVGRVRFAIAALGVVAVVLSSPGAWAAPPSTAASGKPSPGATPNPSQPARGGKPTATLGSAAAVAKKPDEAARREATQLLNQGLTYLKDARFGEALERFEKAYARVPSAKLLLNIGTSLRHLHRPSAAAEAYERYLAHPEATADRVREVERILTGIDREVAWVELEPTPRNARVTVDGELVIPKREALRVRVDPGTHVFVGELPAGGLLPKVVSLELKAGERRTVPLVLESKPSAVVVKDGSMQRMLGFGIGGFGVAALGAGGVLGLVARGSDSLAAEHCANATLCDAEGGRLGARASREALASTLAFAVGGAAVAAGVVLVVLAPSSAGASEKPGGASRTAVEAIVRPDGASLRVRW